MKKRWLGLVAAILMAVSPVLIIGAGAESELLYKLQRQLDAGSGLKGTVTVSGVTGLEGLTLDAQYIQQKTQSELSMSLKNAGSELAGLAVYHQDGALALDLGLASGKLYSLQKGWESLLSRLAAGDTAGWQTPWQSALLAILSSNSEEEDAKLAQAAAPYFTKIDLWMQGFAEPPLMEKDPGGASVIKASFRIPSAAFKAELKQLLVDLLSDKTLLPLLWARMTPEQANLYLNPALQAFYFTAVDALPLQGDITMLRRVTTMGQVLETSLSLPLNGKAGETKQISITNKTLVEGELLDCTLTTGDGTLQFTVLEAAASQPDHMTYSGMVRYLPAEIPNWQVDANTPQYAGNALSVTYQASYVTKLSTDADGKSNESYTLDISLAPDWSHLSQPVTDEVKAQYVLTEPVQITASATILSAKARNASTSLQAQLRVVSGANDWSFSGQFKTTPPWTFQAVDMAAAEKLESLDTNQLNALLTEFLSEPGLLPLLINLVPQDQQIPGTVG